MPSDRHEALHLILGFCKDNGLETTYRSLCWEAGLDATTEELAPHVSLMRILLDWKRAFEARFQGTPRIIQPLQKQEPVALAHLSTPIVMNQVQQHPQQQQPAYQEAPAQHQPIIHGAQQASYQLPTNQPLPTQPTPQDMGNGSLQTIQYMPSNAQPLMNSNQHLFRSQPVHLVQGQGQAPQQYVLAQSQQLGSSDLQDHAGNNGIRPQGPPPPLQQPRSLEQMPLPNGLPPRPPGAVPSHSSSLYSPHDQPEQQDCSRDASPDWQPNEEDNGGHSQHRNSQWGGINNNHNSHNNANNANNMMASARRTSSTGSLPPVTKLKGGAENITQDTFLAVVSAVGDGASASQLFDFRRPQRGSSSSARRSAILQLDDAQHDAMYALAGCEDVNFLISNVQSEVRIAMHKVFGIDKESFTVWFKNRGRNPSKTQYAGAFTGKNGMKRARMSDNGHGTPSPE